MQYITTYNVHGPISSQSLKAHDESEKLVITSIRRWQQNAHLLLSLITLALADEIFLVRYISLRAPFATNAKRQNDE